MIDFGPNEQFIENYKKLKSSRKMAELYNCSKNAVTRHAQKIGYDYTGNKEIKIINIPIEQVVQDYIELGSAKAVGQKYNCSGTTVLNYLKSNGYQPQNATQKLTNISPEDFIINYEQVKSAEKMGKIYNCSSTAILNYAKKINYNVNLIKRDYKLSDEDKQAIIDGYKTKITSTKLAEKYNVSRGMITKLWYDAKLSGKQNNGGENGYIDITGQKFGKWTVLSKTDKKNAGGTIYWDCRCDCGIERDVLGSSLRNGLSLSCGAHSNISKGNEKIKFLLKQANIPFEIEKKFDTCIDKTYLPFDFYVNNSYLIEYDGMQHFQESVFDYEYTHNHDLIKSQWCKDNGIILIRIPYTHYDKLILEDLIPNTSKFIDNNAD